MRYDISEDMICWLGSILRQSWEGRLDFPKKQSTRSLLGLYMKKRDSSKILSPVRSLGSSELHKIYRVSLKERIYSRWLAEITMYDCKRESTERQQHRP